jgi:hypothetical protein
MIAEIARMFPDESMLSLRAAYRARTAPQALEVQPDAPVKADSLPPVIEAATSGEDPATAPCLSHRAAKVEKQAIAFGIAPERARRIALIVDEQENQEKQDILRLARSDLAKLALRALIQRKNGHHQS